MPPIMVSRKGNGKLVAFEGDINTISTQLRLLPQSQKILILPSPLEEAPRAAEENFDARSFIRDIHARYTERTEAACDFLRSSTKSHPRLVFMNGGSIAARTICISKIDDEITKGNLSEAESIFNEIVKDGVKCLIHPQWSTRSESIEDRQVTLEILGNTFPSPPRENVATGVLTVPISPTTLLERRNTFGPPERPLTAPPTFSTVRSVPTEDESEEDEELDVPGSPARNSLLSVVYGEACLVDMQAGPPVTPDRPVRTVKRIDLFHPSNARVQESNLTSRLLKHTKSALQLSPRSVTSSEVDDSGKLPAEISQLPTSVFREVSQTTIQRSPKIWSKSGSSASSNSSTFMTVRGVFIGKSIDTGETPALATEAVEDEPEPEPFEAVFPLIEDLVVHISSETSNEILDSILRSSKVSSYPSSDEVEVCNSPGISVSSADEVVQRPASQCTMETDCEVFHLRREFEPYFSDHSQPPHSGHWLGQCQCLKHNSVVQNLAPPTPLATPPLSMKDTPKKFYHFNPGNRHSIIGIQNSLRSFLSLHFPTGGNRYSQHSFPVAPEVDRLWKPVWSYDARDVLESRSVDHIIALGCEDGVSKRLFAQISGKVERLGMKRNGTNKSAKLDLRYLLANVVISNMPPTKQQDVNLESDPALLATLLVPHLEAYLAANTNTRLLILTYTATHLSTILALRSLLGTKLFKIAGVLDSSDAPTTLVARSRSSSHAISNKSIASLRKQSPNHLNRPRANSLYITTARQTLPLSPLSPPRQPEKVSFSKANYLLPSTATDAETATFLSSISSMLMRISTFYTPEPDPKPVIIERFVERIIERPASFSAPVLLPPTSSRTPRDLRIPPRKLNISHLTGRDGGRFPRRKMSAGSICSTLTARSAKTFASAWRDGDGLLNYFAGEDESEEDLYEKKLMGRAGARPINQSQKSGKKKALKWLGLA